MRNKITPNIPKTFKISTERWVRIFPDEGERYRLYDPMDEIELGCILFDVNGFWIYEGELLSVAEQEEVAGFIAGYEKEMDELLKTIKDA
ncbi:hypothetical protein AB6735_03960 [Mucilaginibacter sp. RCC_168]|uniref:hypothetical protein n=1 Tax=Mucilaginibacter sp. RCC_168 TaxID=3239221 RepID=UPI003523C55E